MEPPTRLLGARFEAALPYAAQLHAAQIRKGTAIPYVSHLLSVCAIVLEHGGNEDQAIAALLHDAVEDQGGRPTLEEIQRRFGDTVAHIVEACSDSDTAVKGPWRERKERYLAHLKDASREVMLVSASDKLHNARSIVGDLRRNGPALWSRFSGGREGTLWYYETLVSIFQAARLGTLADELQRVVGEMRALADKDAAAG